MKKYLSIMVFIIMTGCFFTESEKNNNNNNNNNSNMITFDIVGSGRTRNVDILFQIDSSGSMRGAQTTLQNNFSSFLRVLKDVSGGMPNVHIGVITPDIGTYTYNVGGCEGVGDDGRLLKGSCANPVGQDFIVDVEAAGCNIDRDADSGICGSHDCTQANCDVSAFTVGGVVTEPAGLQFAEDDDGCPRCRNYTGEDIESVFNCISAVGTYGCGFEQQFEALTRALTPGNNPGFLRSDAYLAVYFVTDEDDCSSKQPGIIFDDEDTSISGNLGPLSSFRCTEFGIVCDQPWQRIMTGGTMNYTDCHSRPANDNNNLLQPVSTYTAFLSSIKSSESIIVAAIAGPANNGALTVSVDENSWPELNSVCYAPGDTVGALPGIRLFEFINYFTEHDEDLRWAFTSICNPDYSQALEGFGEKIKSKMDFSCPQAPIKGCPDPAAALGLVPLTNLDYSEAQICNPDCSVDLVYSHGERVAVPQCPEEYMGGHPDKFDPNLPVNVCWHVGFNEECADALSDYGPSRGAYLLLSSKTIPPAEVKFSATCESFGNTETICNDDIDNDYDGFIDNEDLDCYGK